MSKQLNIYTINTVQDKETMLDLLRDLKPHGESIQVWNDNPIVPNQQWKFEEESRLAETDVFLFFISNAFMHSAFINQIEFKWIIDHYKAGETKVIPILLDDCPWDTEFLSEDYKFSFNELEVLPEGSKPIKNWEVPDQGYASVAASIQSIVSPTAEKSTTEEPIGVIEEVMEVKTEEQIALNFDEVAAEKKVAEEQERQTAALEAKRIAEADKRALEAEAAKKQEAKEMRLSEEIEARKKAQEKKRLAEQAEARRIAEEEKRIARETEAAQRAAEEQRNIETQKRKKAAKVAAAKQKDEKHKQRREIKNSERTRVITAATKKGINKKLLIATAVGVLAFLAILIFNNDDDGAEEVTPMVSETKETPNKEVLLKDTVSVDNLKTDTEPMEVTLSKVGIGDSLEGGLIFSVDSDGKTGQIVQLEDAGPMPWQRAIKIHEQLGEGWHLPSLEELQLIRKTVGQGADNRAEFADGLYWSDTPYDEHQARLLRFRDGNTSYHYNRNVETRKFLVRAIKDFSR